MALDEFYQNVRLGLRLRPGLRSHGPEGVSTDQPDFWLTPGTVAGYDPRDFEFLEEPEVARLTGAVEGFRRVASTVDPHGPATQAQSDEGDSHLRTILSIAQCDKYILPEEFQVATVLERFLPELCTSTGLDILALHSDIEPTSGLDDFDVLVWAVMSDRVAEDPTSLIDNPAKFRELRDAITNRLRRAGVRWPIRVMLRTERDQRAVEEACRA